MSLDKVEQFESASGIGVHGIVGGRRLALGNVTLMAQEGIQRWNRFPNLHCAPKSSARVAPA
jgi:cation transport ATPase